MKKPLSRKLFYLVSVSVLMLASFTCGVFFMRHQNNPLKAARQVYAKISERAESERKGVWRLARSDARNSGLSLEQREAMEKMSSLPYLKGYHPAPDLENVTIYDERLAYDGLNLVVSSNAANAFVIDMRGQILHEWRKDFHDVWPNDFSLGGIPIYKDYWRRAHLFENGDLLAIFTDHGLVKLDKDSNLLWSYKARCHHDLFEAENGNIYVLVRKIKRRPKIKLESAAIANRFQEDFITILSPDGKETRNISLFECFLNSNYASLLEHMKVEDDIFHTNTIRLIDGSLADTHPMFKKGHILISIRMFHTIAVVDPENETITWALTGMWKFQHEPRIMQNGNVLLFDNRGNNGQSKIIEFDPLTQAVAWTYKGSGDQPFFSMTAGTNERLPNGNTLITESDYGRAFEVTPAGKIVWEFLNPNRAGENDELIAALYEVVRFDPEYLDWLNPDTVTN